MIRFVDLTQVYWLDPDGGKPVCAFLDTVTDKFIENMDGTHLFTELYELETSRLFRLVPTGFFDSRLTVSGQQSPGQTESPT